MQTVLTCGGARCAPCFVHSVLDAAQNVLHLLGNVSCAINKSFFDQHFLLSKSKLGALIIGIQLIILALLSFGSYQHNTACLFTD